MASGLIWYYVDLSNLEQAEFERVYGLIADWAYTGPRQGEGYRCYTFTWNEQKSVEEVTGLPASAFRLLSGR